MKKKQESKMTKPIVLDEKIPKGVDKTLIAGNSIIMTQTTHSYDEFVSAGKITKATSPKQSKHNCQKTTGKSTSVNKVSAKKAVSAKQTKSTSSKRSAMNITAAPNKLEQAAEKRRVYKSMPRNYSVVQGTVAQSDGTILIHNGKPLFKEGKDGKPQQIKDSRGKPAHKIAKLVVDPIAFNKAKNDERKLVDVEIRKHNDAKGGHPHIVVDTVDGKNVSVGITHSKKKGKKHNNIPLEHNPLGEREQSYMLKQGTVDKKQNYSSTKTTGKLTEKDNEKAKQIGEKAKQKHLNNKRKK